MINKEFKEVGKQMLLLAAIILIPLVLFPLVMSGTSMKASFGDIFFPMVQAVLLFFSLFLGISLFSNERRSQGMEYILSLPFSRMQLLIYKLVPRVVMLGLLYLFYLLMLQLGGADHMFITTLSFTYIYIILFVVSLYFSVASDNFVVSAVAGLIILGLVLAVILGSYLLANSMRGGEPRYVDGIELFHLESNSGIPGLLTPVVIVLLLPFLIAFILSFKRVDIRPARQFNRKYFKLFIPLIVIALGLSLLFAYLGLGHGYRFYYLSSKMQLFESNYHTSKVYTGDSVKKIDQHIGWWSTVEKDSNLYDIGFDEEQGIAIGELDLINLKSEILYKPDMTTKMGYKIFIYKDTLAFVEIHTRSKKTYGSYLVKIDLKTKKMDRIKLIGGLHLRSLLIGADELEGEHFWLLAVHGRKDFTDHKGYIIYRIWDNGKQEELSRIRGNHAYLNHQLITTDERGLVFERLTTDSKELIKVIPEGKNLILSGMWYRRNLNNLPVKELYCYRWAINRKDLKRKSQTIFVLNLETHELKPVAKKKGWIRYFYPDATYLLMHSRETDPEAVPGGYSQLHHLSNGTITLLKEFKPAAEIRGWGVTRSGLVVKENGKIKVYALPDMKEIVFKKL